MPLLTRKPGALRNGAPFEAMDLPPSMADVQSKLHAATTITGAADKAFVRLLALIPQHGIERLAEACTIALSQGTVSADVIENIVYRLAEPAATVTEDITLNHASALPLRLQTLSHPPAADCQRYDALLNLPRAKTTAAEGVRA